MSELALDSVDDIELRARSIQGVGTVGSVPLKLDLPTPGGLSPVSSIGLAEKKEYAPQFRPELSPPKGYDVRYDLIAKHLESIRLSDKGAALFDEEIKVGMDDIQRHQKDKQEALRKEAEAVKSRTTWSTAATVAEYIAGASFLVLGCSTLGISAVAGLLLIGSGLAGLGERLLHDTPLMDKFVCWMRKTDEDQKKLAAQIDLLLLGAQIGLGVAGGAWAWHAGAFAAAQAAGSEAAIEKASAIVSAGSQIMSTGANVGVQYYNKQISDMQARMKEIHGQITTDQQTIYQDSNAMARIIESIQGETEAIRRALQDFQIAID